jgi:hypothetical protein
MIAITAVVLERCRLIDKIDTVTPEQEEEERLSEQVMDIDAALGELAGPYQRQRLGERLYPEYEELMKSVESNYGSEKKNS